MKKYQNFLSENFLILVVKFSVYLNRQVFVMKWECVSRRNGKNVKIGNVKMGKDEMRIDEMGISLKKYNAEKISTFFVQISTFWPATQMKTFFYRSIKEPSS